MDLNWCPCGKQCLEDSLYCSDMCYLKDLASNSNINKKTSNPRNRKSIENDGYFYTPTSFFNKDKKDNDYLKVPDFKNTYDNFILSIPNNLEFKNRHKYHHRNNHQTKNYYKNSYKNIQNKISNKYFNTINSTIDDYFKKQTDVYFKKQTDDYFKKETIHAKEENSKVESSSKQNPVAIIVPKENENAKERKNELKSYSSRSSYIIEAVYPVQNFNKNTIVVF